MENHSNVGCVAPQFIFPDGALQPSARSFPKLHYTLFGRRSIITRIFTNNPLSKKFLYAESMKWKKEGEVEAVVGAFMLFRRQALEEVGYFSKEFFLFAEDLDICYRLRQKNWKVFLCSEVKVIHFVGKAREKNYFSSEKDRVKSLYRFFLKHRKETHLLNQLVFTCAVFFLFVQNLLFQDLKEKLF